MELHAFIHENVLAHPQLAPPDNMDLGWIASTGLPQLKLKATQDCVLEWIDQHSRDDRVSMLGLPMQTLIYARDTTFDQLRQAKSQGCSFGMLDNTYDI